MDESLLYNNSLKASHDSLKEKGNTLYRRKLGSQTLSGIASNIYNMSGRSVSVYTDTRALHEHLCTLIQNGHKYCRLLINCDLPHTVMFSSYV